MNTYRAKHNLKTREKPPFSIYWRNRIGYNNLTTQALVFRCDATAQKFYVKLLTRLNKCGVIPEKKGHFIPLAVIKNNENATKRAMDGQNKYLTTTISIPIIGLSFKALKTEIEVGKTGKATIKSIIYQHCLSLEPTAKSEDLGRFNLICSNSDTESTIKFIKQDIPIMWSLLPRAVANKFPEPLHVAHPRLTAGFSGAPIGTNNSITLEDPQSVGTNYTTETESTQPPSIQRPPRYVSVIYNEAKSNPKIPNPSNNQSKTNLDKSHTTIQLESDLSTLVSSIREEMTKELQARTDLITALKDEISQLQKEKHPYTTRPNRNPDTHNNTDRAPSPRDRLDELFASDSKPCLTAAVMRGTMFSTIDVIRSAISGTWDGPVGIALRNSCIS